MESTTINPAIPPVKQISEVENQRRNEIMAPYPPASPRLDDKAELDVQEMRNKKRFYQNVEVEKGPSGCGNWRSLHGKRYHLNWAWKAEQNLGT